ncbi:MAG: hypothetical protein ACXV8J_11685, partial [Methylobacter sp.]
RGSVSGALLSLSQKNKISGLFRLWRKYSAAINRAIYGRSYPAKAINCLLPSKRFRNIKMNLQTYD